MHIGEFHLWVGDHKSVDASHSAEADDTSGDWCVSTKSAFVGLCAMQTMSASQHVLSGFPLSAPPCGRHAKRTSSSCKLGSFPSAF